MNRIPDPKKFYMKSSESNNQNKYSYSNVSYQKKDRIFDNLYETRSSIGVCNNYMIPIIPNLWIGNIDKAQDIDLINNNNINILINCCKNQNIPIQKSVYYPPNIKIHLCDSILKKANYYTDLIEEYLKNENKILIFCETGIQQSPTLVGCYLIRYTRLEHSYVINSLKSKNPVFFTPNIEYLSLLDAFTKHYVNNYNR